MAYRDVPGCHAWRWLIAETSVRSAVQLALGNVSPGFGPQLLGQNSMRFPGSQPFSRARHCTSSSWPIRRRRPMAARRSPTSTITAMPPPEIQIISDFTTRLALRRDGDRVRAALAIAFYDRYDSLWPVDSSCPTPQWIANNVNETLATVERLYGDAVPSGDAGIPQPHGVAAQAARKPRSAGAARHHSRCRATTSRATSAI